MARRRRRGQEEEHENHERWMVTYADMVTLLMVLFIVMFAMSQVDERKYKQLKDGLAAGFGQSAMTMDGAESILEEPGTSTVKIVRPQQYRQTMTEEQWAAVEAATAEQERLRLQRRYAEARAEVDRLREVQRRIDRVLREKGLRKDVETRIDERGLAISLVSRHVVFDNDVATLTRRGRQVVDTLAPVLRDLPDPLQIDGHTNQVPVTPKYYETDWDLSAARAITVLRRLNESHRIPAERMTASAFGAEKPLRDPGRPGSMAVNKRVDIVVLTSLPAETRELIDDVTRDPGGKS